MPWPQNWRTGSRPWKERPRFGPRWLQYAIRSPHMRNDWKPRNQAAPLPLIGFSTCATPLNAAESFIRDSKEQLAELVRLYSEFHGAIDPTDPAVLKAGLLFRHNQSSVAAILCII